MRSALETLDAVVVADGWATVLTVAGLARPARGRDAALLDTSTAADGPIGVVRCDRPGWSADALARSWGERFVPFDVQLLRHTDEAIVPDADFASRHDDEARLGWLAARFREALEQSGTRWSALVLPPSLGLERGRAEWLSNRVGVPCGEAMGLPGGPAGLRFERARDRAIRALGIHRLGARASRIEQLATGLRVHVEGGGRVEARTVILATGGLIGGGIEYAPSEAELATVLPAGGRPALRVTIYAPVSLGAGGQPLEIPGSLFGSAPEAIAAPFVRDALLDRVGVLVGADGAVSAAPPSTTAGRGIYAAGEVVADAARTWLGALASGVRAGSSAARHALMAANGPLARSPDEATASPP
jgi:hypothetical protein